jgi:hypothetical protein
VPPDSVRCTRELDAQFFTFGKTQRRSTIIHRTVRCTTGQCLVPQRRATLNSPASDFCSAIIHWTCPMHTGLSGEPAEQRLLRANGRLQRIKCAPARRGAEHARVAHRTVYRTCPVRHRTAKRAHTSKLQRPGDVAGAPDSVRWRTGLSGAPCDCSLHQTASLVVGVINTPNHPTFKSSEFSHFNYLQEL